MAGNKRFLYRESFLPRLEKETGALTHQGSLQSNYDIDIGTGNLDPDLQHCFAF
jgi:hypothetical protein